MKQDKIRIVYRRTDQLVPDNDNPRRNDMAVDAVANSIHQFGMRVPIIITKENRIVAGHTRHKACTRLCIDRVPCVVADGLTERQLKAFMLADNKTGELATWDMSLLAIQMDSLSTLFDMTDFGFQPKKVKQPERKAEDSVDNEYAAPQGYVRCPRCGYVFEQEQEDMPF